jgi:type I restriction enzyme M protein
LPKAKRTVSGGSAATVGYEAQLWQMADTLRGNMDAAEYKHVCLGLLFLKYISDAFEERHTALIREKAQGADPEDPDEYRAHNIFWVPPEARWTHLKAQARQSTIGQLVDSAMEGIERDNPALKGVLPRDYARPALDKERLGQLIEKISNIAVGDNASRAKDVLGRVYEYFLSQFASAEGKKGGEFYTPRCVVKLLVEMLEPYRGRVYDPCCGSSGMFVQSVAFIRAHASGNGNGGSGNGGKAAHSAKGGARPDISIYGQESNYTTWRLARMNLAIRGIDGQIGHGDTFHNDRHPDLKADFILANPPFNISDWGGERLQGDKRWQYGAPPAGNANFAWVQHIVHHLAPAGVAGFVLANGSMSSNQSGEGEIRKNLIEADLVDCMVALPGQLFYSTQIPACLWFLARDRKNGKFRDRRGQVLFIDARKLGRMADRTHKELTDEDIARIATTYHAWRGEQDAGGYADIAGFCKSAPLEEVRRHGFVLTPGRYVGAEAMEDDGEPFEDKMKRLTATLREQQTEAANLDAAIAANLKELGYGG